MNRFCPHCHRLSEVPEEMQGELLACPHCRAQAPVPILLEPESPMALPPPRARAPTRAVAAPAQPQPPAAESTAEPAATPAPRGRSATPVRSPASLKLLLACAGVLLLITFAVALLLFRPGGAFARRAGKSAQTAHPGAARLPPAPRPRRPESQPVPAELPATPTPPPQPWTPNPREDIIPAAALVPDTPPPPAPPAAPVRPPVPAPVQPPPQPAPATPVARPFTVDTPWGGTWTPVDSGLAQRSLGVACVMTFGDATWDNYELSLEACKQGGAEGFLVLVRVAGPHDFHWCNLGGWGNRAHGLERASGGRRQTLVAPSVPGHIDPDRWYRIRVRCEGLRFQAWLDDTLVLDVTEPRAAGGPTTGKAGFGTWSTQAVFRNVRVTTLDGQVLCAGLPPLPPRPPGVGTRSGTTATGRQPATNPRLRPRTPRSPR